MRTFRMHEVRDVIPTDESETVKFEERWTDKPALSTLSACAESRGGPLLAGVADDGRAVGWKGDEGDMDRLTHRIVDSLRVHPTAMHVEPVEDRNVLQVEVGRSSVSVAYDGRYYRRVGRTTCLVHEEEALNPLLRRSRTTWDTQPVDLGWDEVVDEALWARFLRISVYRLPKADMGENPASVLKKLDSLSGEAPTVAAALLFGMRP